MEEEIIRTKGKCEFSYIVQRTLQMNCKITKSTCICRWYCPIKGTWFNSDSGQTSKDNYNLCPFRKKQLGIVDEQPKIKITQIVQEEPVNEKQEKFYEYQDSYLQPNEERESEQPQGEDIQPSTIQTRRTRRNIKNE